MNERRKMSMARVLTFVAWVYFAGFLIAAPYFNWTYARTHGFMKWLFLGEIVATFRAAAWPYHLVRTLWKPQGSTAGSVELLTEEDVRALLGRVTEEANRELDLVSFLPEDCPALEAGEACLELFHVEIRSDLGIDRHYRVHNPSIDLDENREAREAWASLMGAGDSWPGFYQEHEELCNGETLQLMRHYGIRIGIFHHTVGGTLITNGIIDLDACTDFLEQTGAISE